MRKSSKAALATFSISIAVLTFAAIAVFTFFPEAERYLNLAIPLVLLLPLLIVFAFFSKHD